MRLHRTAPILAALASAAAITSPTAAHARASSAGTGGGPVAIQSHHPASPGTDWSLLGGATAGGVLVLAGGLTAAWRAQTARPRTPGTAS